MEGIDSYLIPGAGRGRRVVAIPRAGSWRGRTALDLGALPASGGRCSGVLREVGQGASPSFPPLLHLPPPTPPALHPPPPIARDGCRISWAAAAAPCCAENPNPQCRLHRRTEMAAAPGFAAAPSPRAGSGKCCSPRWRQWESSARRCSHRLC